MYVYNLPWVIVNVLKELCCTKEETDSLSNIPNMNSLRTQLPIYLEISEDSITRQVRIVIELAGIIHNSLQMGEVHSYPVLPTMTVDEVCKLLLIYFTYQILTTSLSLCHNR